MIALIILLFLCVITNPHVILLFPLCDDFWTPMLFGPPCYFVISFV